MTTSEFLPRAHSKKLGELDRSNWKSLEVKHNVERIDPPIREVVLSLNNKGYWTFSSCSGGHRTDHRWKVDRHESGYLAFSPPSTVAFTLYLALRRKNRDFSFEAQAVIDDGDGSKKEMVCTRLYWQLLDERESKLKYYNDLFAEMKRVIGLLPKAPADGREVLAGLLGRKQLPVGLKIVREQMKRFKTK